MLSWNPQSPLNRRMLYAGGSFAIVFALYWVYALAAVPLIEPPADAPRHSEGERPGNLGSMIEDRIAALAPLFPPGSWELDNPKILESDQVKLLIQDYENLEGGILKINRCTIILTPRGGDDGQDSARQLFIMQAPDGAVMQFDKGLNLRRMEVGRLVSGDLKGEITIRSFDLQKYNAQSASDDGEALQGENKKSPYGDSPRGNLGSPAGQSDDLLIVTRDVHLSENEITTPHPVSFRWGGSYGLGRDMRIKLLRGEAANAKSKDAPNIAGMESFRLEHVERLHIEPGKISTKKLGAGSDGVRPTAYGADMGPILGSPGDSSKSNSVGGRGGSALDLPLEVACNGPLTFDVPKRVATLEDRDKGLDVFRVHPDGQNDQLHGQLISIFFTERQTAVEQSAGNASGAQKPAKTGSMDLTPWKIEAQGNPVVITAPSQQVFAQGQILSYDLQANRISMQDRKEVVLRQGPNEIHALSATYQSAGPGRLGSGEATGPGWLRARLSDSTDQIIEARWNEQLLIRPYEQEQLISLTGGTSLNNQGFGRMDARDIFFWLKEAPAAGAGNQRGLQPSRMLARGEVRINTQQLDGEVERIEIWFERDVNRGGLVPVVGAVAGIDSSLGIGAASKMPLGQPLQLVPRQTSPESPLMGMSPSQDQSPSAARHFTINGRTVRAKVIMRDAQHTDLAELMMEDNVRLVETQTAAPGERPLMVAGERLHVVDAYAPYAAVTIAGSPARFEGRGLSLTGPNINLNRGTNRLWIDGPGRMGLPLDRDLQNRPMPNGGVLQVDWRQRMAFDGRTARFEEAVAASTPMQNLRTETLEVQLQQRIDFAAASMPQDPKLEQVRCLGGVSMENREFKGDIQLAHDRMSVADLAVNFRSGELKAAGPGWFTAVRRAENDQLNGLHVRFQGPITGNVLQKSLTFHDQIHAAYAPVDAWLPKLDPDDPESLGPNGITMHCDQISVNEMPTFIGDRHAMEFEALGNTVVEGGGKFTARGHRITYAEAKDQLILEGDGRTDATLFYQEQIGGLSSKQSARKILYWPKTNKYWIEGVRSLEVNQIPLLKPAAKPAAGKN
jgi:lipopolysaccharide export system protein LptA